MPTRRRRVLIIVKRPPPRRKITIFAPTQPAAAPNRKPKHTTIMKKQICTNQAPAAIGPYSQAVEVNGMIFVSGQIPVDPATGEFVEGGIKEMTQRVLTNIKNILAEEGLTMQHVVKTCVFLADIADFAAMNEVYASFFDGVAPARSAMAVKSLPKGARVEIECIAVR